jgi:GAF domain-containing protein
MNGEAHFVKRLKQLSQYLESHESPAEQLDTFAKMAADLLGCRHCYIMLVKTDPESSKMTLRVQAHFGECPKQAYEQGVDLSQSVAGHVVRSGQPMLINDVGNSELQAAEVLGETRGTDLLSVPIDLDGEMVGVVNLSSPLDGRRLGERDLQMATMAALVMAKSIHIQRLQQMLRTQFIPLAVAREAVRQKETDLSSLTGDPHKVAKVLARSLFEEMRTAGFARGHMLTAATELIGMITEEVGQADRGAGGALDRDRA